MGSWKCACGANLYINESGEPASKAEHENLVARLARLEWRLRAILDEPAQTMSDGKALTQIVRHAKLALAGQ